MLKIYKFQIVPVCQKVENGEVIGEETVSQNGQPIVVFGLTGLKLFADSFEEQLRAAQES